MEWIARVPDVQLVFFVPRVQRVEVDDHVAAQCVVGETECNALARTRVDLKVQRLTLCGMHREWDARVIHRATGE